MGQLVEWPEVITEGKTIEKCRAMLQDALNEMIKAYKQQKKRSGVITFPVSVFETADTKEDLEECARFREENKRLRALLGIHEEKPAVRPAISESALTDDKIALFRSLFRGRQAARITTKFKGLGDIFLAPLLF